MMSEQLASSGVREGNEPAIEPPATTGAAEYRYPGVPPFADSDMDRLLFKGRTAEIDQVLHSILSFDLFLIYGVSGLGKTSLLTAGVLEPLRQRDFFPVILRLNDSKSSPVELIDEQIRQAAEKAEGISISRHPSARGAGRAPANLWDLLSELEVWKGNTLQRLILIFDQFEELFTLGWSDDQRDQFIEQFGQVIRHHRPPASRPEANGAVVLPPPQVKITLSMREDFLGELEALAKQVPQIMAHRFRLDGLQPDQAERAIREPAQVNDPRLKTPRFSYSEGAAHAILGFLGAREERGRPVATRSIDPSQLQIICQHVERSILPDKGPATADGAVVEISEDDLGGTNGLETILRDFYRREVSAFAKRERKLVRNLCEVGLINQSGRRLSLEEGEIEAKFHVKKSTLEGLVARRLLRAEPRVGSVYYELAHDTLAAPILAYRQAERSARRRHWIWTLIAAAAVVAIIGVVLLASRDDPAPPKIAVGGAPVPGKLEGGRSTVFEFDASDNETVLVEVVPASNLDTLLQVTGPGGLAEWADNGIEGYAETAVVDATKNGRYRVEVNGATSGTFTLSARPVEVGFLTAGDEARPGTIDADNPVSVFQFEVLDNRAFLVDVVPESGLDARLQVTDPNGVVESADNAAEGGTETTVLNATDQGRYRIVVSGRSSGAFKLSVHPVEVGELTVGGQSLSGTIDSTNSVGVFEFQAPGDQPVVVGVVPSKSLDATLEVTDPSGNLASADNAGQGFAETTVLDASEEGRYRVVISGRSSGAFQVFVRPEEAVGIVVGDPVLSGTIDATSPVGVFEFEASGDQTLVVDVVPDGGLDAMLEVTDPDGFVEQADNGANGRAEAIVLGTTLEGHYRIVVSGRSSGAFKLFVRPPDVTELAVGEPPISSSIDSTNPVGVLEFQASDDHALIVDLLPGNSLDAILQVSDPNGVAQTADWGAAGGAETVVVDGTVSGWYRIIVSGFESTTGRFEISVRPVEVDDLTVGDAAVSGTIDENNPTAVFGFTAPADETFTVEVVPDGSLHPVLEVTDHDGVLASVWDDLVGSTQSAQVYGTTDGRYLVVVRGYNSTTGDYTLSVQSP